jgi:hypothetical protein
MVGSRSSSAGIDFRPNAVSNIRQLTYHLAGPKPASVFQMTVAAASLRVQDFAAPKAQHLQAVIHVVGGVHPHRGFFWPTNTEYGDLL